MWASGISSVYHLQFFERSCRVVDDDDRVLFAGSYRECEEWLDSAENRAALAEKVEQVVETQPGWLGSIRAWFVDGRHGLISKSRWRTSRSA